MAIPEHNLNVELRNLLEQMRTRWKVQAEPLRTFEGNAQRPDILITEVGALPAIIEHEIRPARNVEQEALARLGLVLQDSGQEIQVVIALRSPSAISYGNGGAALRRRWVEGELEYVLFRKMVDGKVSRWPVEGWIQGRARDMALFLQHAMRPGEEIDALADILERQIERAASAFNRAWPQGHSGAGTMLSHQLRLEDDGIQTRRMAMAILANALIFHQALAPLLDDIDPPSLLKKARKLNDEQVLRQWEKILDENYRPIFRVASEILVWMDQPRVAAEILSLLHEVNLQIEILGAARSHDLTGFVFQRLISERKFLATYYTRPESAALLAALVLPQKRPVAGAVWADPITVAGLQIGDFACGTGTLLSAVYQRLAALHELHGQNAANLHENMLEHALVGCDVLPIALHLTLSMLASNFPDIPFFDCKMLLMPYGRNTTEDAGEEYNLGSLDLLVLQDVIPGWSTHPEIVTDDEESEREPERHRVEDGSFDLILMNPPFTRAGGQEGRKIGVSVPAFAALQNTREEQQVMSKLLSKMAKGSCYDGKAGLASAFTALAHRKLHDEGTMGLVLPVTMIQGESWRKVRRLLSAEYRDVIVVTIAAAKSDDCSFSADTGMGECLVVASRLGENPGRATFICLRERPNRLGTGELLAELIHERRERNLGRLEEETSSDTLLRVGEESFGTIIDAPIDEGPWRLEGILDLSVAQTAWHLAEGRLLLANWPTGTELPMTSIDSLAKTGPYHQQIYRTDGEGAFEKVDGTSPSNYYPMLWSHDADLERCMVVQPDSHGIPRDHDRATELARTSSQVHHNRDFRFNSQSLAACWTEKPTLGGHAWPTLQLSRGQGGPAYVLWANSTLGLLCYWWHSTKQQGGRGRIPISAIGGIPTLDLHALSDEQLAAAASIFEDMKHCPMLPVNQIDEDRVRAELDRRLLTEVLGLPAELCAKDGPMALLRRKLAAEPSIHGGKLEKNKVRLEVPEDCLPQ
ncbi:MAG: hypothetical protein OXF32_02015 [Anaerolineaceae bacterium]|nr:hypothetical protein [Anaerolineaceae bacterium]